MTGLGPQQILDAVDKEDRVVGSVRRGDVFRVGANFRVAHLFLFNDRSEMLVQRLASSRPRHPGCWGSSVAAYVNSGESCREAIERRAQQELGVLLECVTFLGKTSMSDDKCLKFISLFLGSWHGPLAIDTSHISKIRFLPVADLLRARKSEPWLFTPTFVHLLDMHYDRIS